ncbi:hypothetical protein CRM22_006428 [Opisthorchis felineus]|uniref:Uncharacterized protein n=1 Tax=Opisthorchis felineus TaxID=147828 RepID=A0A4V3SEF2_OPIFE|nr:hypothetical protein CRM22_006428 [Opisthorchis felineus]TGZ64302.1 hypothetical protein CRM22_006428 [Opisthorchis felineus]TGZ64303.1 hypothetical protein CRM22_006428 [Opisthorchis felineus]TGZ64304.1 hypothetical protein CRM22_006428 [Opisthorchis felineus]
MPRRSGHSSEESPAPRRTSARIAAVQAASPAKSPVKSPRRKRQSAEPTKIMSEDTESQQSQIKSEGSIEEINGLDTSSSTKDRDSVVDSQELPSKKAKVDGQPDEETEKPTEDSEITPKKSEVSEVAPAVVESTPTISTGVSELIPKVPDEVPPKKTESSVNEAPASISTEAVDFEVVEKTDVPAADSAEVEAAVSVQGEDGQLLVGFVQVDKDELPSATSLEIKQVTPSEQPADHVMGRIIEDAPTAHVPSLNSVNGDSKHTAPLDVPPATEQIEPEIHSKLPAITETAVQPSSTPAAGDGAIVDAISPETIPQ